MPLLAVIIAIIISISIAGAVSFLVEKDEYDEGTKKTKRKRKKRDKQKEAAEQKAFDTEEKFRYVIDKISDKIHLFTEVKKHIVEGGPAVGIVWEYSPYMTLEEVDNLLDELTTIQSYLKSIYSQYIINKDLKSIDEELVEIFKDEILEKNRELERKVEQILREINKKYGLGIQED